MFAKMCHMWDNKLRKRANILSFSTNSWLPASTAFKCDASSLVSLTIIYFFKYETLLLSSGQERHGVDKLLI